MSQIRVRLDLTLDVDDPCDEWCYKLVTLVDEQAHRIGAVLGDCSSEYLDPQENPT